MKIIHIDFSARFLSSSLRFRFFTLSEPLLGESDTKESQEQTTARVHTQHYKSESSDEWKFPRITPTEKHMNGGNSVAIGRANSEAFVPLLKVRLKSQFTFLTVERNRRKSFIFRNGRFMKSSTICRHMFAVLRFASS